MNVVFILYQDKSVPWWYTGGLFVFEYIHTSVVYTTSKTFNASQ